MKQVNNVPTCNRGKESVTLLSPDDRLTTWRNAKISPDFLRTSLCDILTSRPALRSSLKNSMESINLSRLKNETFRHWELHTEKRRRANMILRILCPFLHWICFYLHLLCQTIIYLASNIPSLTLEAMALENAYCSSIRECSRHWWDVKPAADNRMIPKKSCSLVIIIRSSGSQPFLDGDTQYENKQDRF